MFNIICVGLFKILVFVFFVLKTVKMIEFDGDLDEIMNLESDDMTI